MLNSGIKNIAGINVARLIDPATGEEVETIQEHLIAKKWSSIIPNHFEENSIQGLLKRSQWKSIFHNRLVVYPGMHWNAEQKCLEDQPIHLFIEETSLRHLLKVVGAFFSRYDGQHIGVQLSGGVDSSLIIGFLRACGISYSLVGLSTERYEFRTERFVQLKLANECGHAELIDYEDCLPFSGLENVVAHAFPDMSSINFASDSAMATACNRLGIDVLLTGSGGDVILGTEVSACPKNCDWRPQIFNYPWPKEVVYARHGVKLVSFFDDPSTVNALYNLRRGQHDDPQKLWARQYFCDFLPAELAEFTYCADFWGVYVDGLQNAIKTITNLHQEVHELTSMSYFLPNNLNRLLGGDLLQTTKVLYQKIESHAALSVWLKSLNKIITQSSE